MKFLLTVEHPPVHTLGYGERARRKEVFYPSAELVVLAAARSLVKCWNVSTVILHREGRWEGAMRDRCGRGPSPPRIVEREEKWAKNNRLRSNMAKFGPLGPYIANSKG